MKACKPNKKLKCFIGLICIAILAIFAMGGTALLTADVLHGNICSAAQTQTSTMTLTDDMLEDAYIVSGNNIYKYIQPKTSNSVSLLSTNLTKLKFNQQNMLKLIFLKDSVTTLSTFAVEDNVASVLTATKADNQIEISIQDSKETVFLQTSLDAQYSFGHLALNANNKLNYINGEFSIDEKRSATSLTGATTKEEAQVFTLDFGSVTFKGNKVYTAEYVIGDDGMTAVEGRAFLVRNINPTDQTTQLTLQKGIVLQGFTATGGAGIYATNYTTVTLAGCEIYHCEAVGGNGGAVESYGNVILEDTIKDSDGVTNITVETVIGSCFANKNSNGYGGDGGAIYCARTVTVKSGKFQNNMAENGGAIYLLAGASLDIDGGKFISNQASTNGGAIYIVGGGDENTIDKATFSTNYATNGGAIYFLNADDSITIWECIFDLQNQATNGGAIYSRGYTTIAFTTLSQNKAENGGAIYCTGILKLTGFNATNNTATNNGGVIYLTGNQNTSLEIYDNSSYIESSVTGNSAGASGGVIYATYADSQNIDKNLKEIKITNLRASNNKATLNGAVCWINSVTVPTTAGTTNVIINGGTFKNNLVTSARSGSTVGSVLSVNLAGPSSMSISCYEISINNATFEANRIYGSSLVKSAAIFIMGWNDNATAAISNCEFKNNIAASNDNDNGNVSDIASEAVLTLADNTFLGNYRSVCNFENGKLTLSQNSWITNAEYAIIHQGNLLQIDASPSITVNSAYENSAGIYLTEENYITLNCALSSKLSVYKEAITIIDEGDANSCYIAYDEDQSRLQDSAEFIYCVNKTMWMELVANASVKSNYLVASKRDYQIRFYADWGWDGATYSVAWQNTYVDQISVENLLDDTYWNYAGANGYTASETNSYNSNYSLTANGQYGYSVLLNSVKHGEAINTIYAPIPICRGFTFTGWYTTDGLEIADAYGNFNQTNFENSGIFERDCDTVADTTLNVFAKWELMWYNYNVDVNGGLELLGKNYSGTYNTVDGFSYEEIPLRPGYTFTGWRVEVQLNKLALASLRSDGVLKYNAEYPNSVIYDMFWVKPGVVYSASLSSIQTYVAVLPEVQWHIYNAGDNTAYNDWSYVTSFDNSVVFPPLGKNYLYDANLILCYPDGNADDYVTVSFSVDNLEQLEEIGFLSSEYNLTGNVTLTAQWQGNIVTVNVDGYGDSDTIFYYRYGVNSYYTTRVDNSLSNSFTTLNLDYLHTGWVLDGYWADSFIAYVNAGNLAISVEPLRIVYPKDTTDYSACAIINELYLYYPVDGEINVLYNDAPTRFSMDISVNYTDAGYLTQDVSTEKLYNITLTNIPYGTIATEATDSAGNTTLTLAISDIMPNEANIVITAHINVHEGYSRSFHGWQHSSNVYISVNGTAIESDLNVTAKFSNDARTFDIYLYDCNDESVTTEPLNDNHLIQTYTSVTTTLLFIVQMDNPDWTFGGSLDDRYISVASLHDYLPTRDYYTFMGYYSVENFDWTNIDGNTFDEENLYITRAGAFTANLRTNTIKNLKLYARWEINVYSINVESLYNSTHCSTVYFEVTGPNGDIEEYYGQTIITGYTIKHSINAIAKDLKASWSKQIGTELSGYSYTHYYLRVYIDGYRKKNESVTTQQDLKISIDNSLFLDAAGGAAKDISACSAIASKLGDKVASAEGEDLSTPDDVNFAIKIYGTSGYSVPIATIYRSENEDGSITFHTDRECTSLPMLNFDNLDIQTSEGDMDIITYLYRDGYTFQGFYSGRYSSATKYVDAYGNILDALKTISGVTSIYGYSTANNYSIQFNSNYPAHGGGESAEDGSMETMTDLVYGSPTTLTANTFTLVGYTFNGWNTQADGNGDRYDNGGVVNIPVDTNGQTVTLYAQWLANVVTVYICQDDSFAYKGYTSDTRVLTLYYVLDRDGYYTTQEAALIQDETHRVYFITPHTTISGFTLQGYILQDSLAKDNGVDTNNASTYYIKEDGTIAQGENDKELYQLRNYSDDNSSIITLNASWARNTYDLTIMVNDPELGGLGKFGYTNGDKVPYGAIFGDYSIDGEEIVGVTLKYTPTSDSWDSDITTIDMTFIWNKNDDLSGYQTRFVNYSVTDDDGNEVSRAKIVGNTTITFNFAAMPYLYSVWLDASGGNTNVSETENLLQEQTTQSLSWFYKESTIYESDYTVEGLEYNIENVIPTWIGRTFVGWFDTMYDDSIEDQNSYGTKYINADGTINEDNPIYNEQFEGIDLYAHWTINTYTLLYNGYFDDRHCTSIYLQIDGNKLYGQQTVDSVSVIDLYSLSIKAQHVTPHIEYLGVRTGFGYGLFIGADTQFYGALSGNINHVNTGHENLLANNNNDRLKTILQSADSENQITITLKSMQYNYSTREYTYGQTLTSSTDENHVRIDMFNTGLADSTPETELSTYYLCVADKKLYTSRDNSQKVTEFEVLDNTRDATQEFIGYNLGRAADGEQYVDKDGNILQTQFDKIVGYTQLATAWQTKTITVTLNNGSNNLEYIYFKAGIEKYYNSSDCIDTYLVENILKNEFGKDYNGYYTGENGSGIQYIAGFDNEDVYNNGAFINDLYKLTENITLHLYMPLHTVKIILDAQQGKFASGSAQFEIYFKYSESALYTNKECSQELSYQLDADGVTKRYFVDVPQAENYWFIKFETGSGVKTVNDTGVIENLSVYSVTDETIPAHYAKIYGVELDSNKYKSDNMDVIHRESTSSGTPTVYYAQNINKYYQSYGFVNGTSVFGAGITSAIEIPTLAGYTFAGYWTNKGGTGVQYIDKNGNFSTANNLYAQGDSTAVEILYAKWEANYYELAIDPNGGRVTFGYKLVYGNSTWSVQSSSVVTKSGIYALYDSNKIFYFDNISSQYSAIISVRGEKYGEYLQKLTSTDEVYTVDNFKTVQLSEIYEVAGAITLNAIWEIEDYVIEFDTNTPDTADYDIEINHASEIEISYNQNTNLADKTYTLDLIGHKFDGYFTADGVQLIDKDGKFIASITDYIDSDTKWIKDLGDDQGRITLYAHWTPITYYTTVNGEKIARTYGDAFEVKFVMPNTGYSTIGYNISGMNEGIKHYVSASREDFENTELLESITTTASALEHCTTKWFKNLHSQENAEVVINQENALTTYTIEYLIDNFVLDDSIVYTTKYTIEDGIILPTITGCNITGYQFDGWLVNNTSNIGSWVAGGKIDVTTTQLDVGQYGYYKLNADGFIDGAEKVVKLEAKSKANNYTLTFNANGGTLNHAESITVTFDSAFALPDLIDSSKTPAYKDGYTFTGYTISESQNIFDANGAVCNLQGYAENGTWKYDDNLTVYAEWGIVNVYTISYNYNMENYAEVSTHSGYYMPNNPTSYTVENDTFRLQNPSMPGHTFAGWTGTGINDAVEDVYINKGSIGNREYTANWQKITYSIVFTNPENFKDNLGNTVKVEFEYTISNEQQILEDATVPHPQKEGYEFSSYSIYQNDKLSPSIINIFTDDYISISAFTYGNIIVDANFTPKIYTIHFEDTSLENMVSKVKYVTSQPFIGEKMISVAYDRPVEFTAKAEAAGYKFNGFVIKDTEIVLFNADGSLNTSSETLEYISNGNWHYTENITVVGSWTALDDAVYYIVLQLQNLDGTYSPYKLVVEKVKTDSFITFDTVKKMVESVSENEKTEFENVTGYPLAGFNLTTTAEEFGDDNQATVGNQTIAIVSLKYDRKLFNLTINNYFEDENGNATQLTSADETFAGFTSQQVAYGSKLEQLQFSSTSSVVYERVEISDDYSASSTMPAEDLTLSVTFYRKQFTISFEQVTQTLGESLNTTKTFNDTTTLAANLPDDMSGVRYGTKVDNLIADKNAMANPGFAYYDIEGVDSTTQVTSSIIYTIRFTRHVTAFTFNYTAEHIAKVSIEEVAGVQKNDDDNYNVAYDAPMNITVTTAKGYIIMIFTVGETNALDYCDKTLEDLQHTYTCSINNQETAQTSTIDIATDGYSKVPYKIYTWQQDIYGSGYELLEVTETTGKTGVVKISDLTQSTADTGFYFAGWSYESGLMFSPQEVTGSINDDFAILGDGSTAIHIFFNRHVYNVDFDLINAELSEVYGKGIFETDGKTKIYFGASITVDAFAETGYTLKNLQVNNWPPMAYKGGVSFVANGHEVDGTYTITITAEANSYTVYYYTWDKTLIVKSEPFTYNTARELDSFASEKPGDPLYLAGYNFVGWATTPQNKRLGTVSEGLYNGLDSNEVELTDGQTVSTLSTGGEVSLYAVYTAKKYMVYLNPDSENGGVNTGIEEFELNVAESQTNVSLSEKGVTDPTRFGYGFKEWTENEVFANISDDTLTIEANTYFENGLTLNAEFESNNLKLTFTSNLSTMKSAVKYIINGIEYTQADEPIDVDVWYEQSIEGIIATAEADGYRFNGFKPTETSEFLFNNVGVVNKNLNAYTSDGKWQKNEDITVYAYWTPLTSNYKINLKVEKLDGSFEEKLLEDVEAITTDSQITFATAKDQVTTENFNKVTGYDLQGFDLQTTAETFGTYYALASGEIVTLQYNRKTVKVVVVDSYQNVESGYSAIDASAGVTAAGTYTYKFGATMRDLVKQGNTKYKDAKFVLTSDKTIQYSNANELTLEILLNKTTIENNTRILNLTAIFDRQTYTVRFIQKTQTVAETLNTTKTFNDTTTTAATITEVIEYVRYGKKVTDIFTSANYTANPGFTYYGLAAVDATSEVTQETTYTVLFTRNTYTATINKDDNVARAEISGTGVSGTTVAFGAIVTITTETNAGYAVKSIITSDNKVEVNKTDATVSNYKQTSIYEYVHSVDSNVQISITTTGNKYTVEYYKYNGTTKIAYSEHYYGLASSLTKFNVIEGHALYQEGYNFEGWIKATRSQTTKLNTAQYANGAVVTDLAMGANGDTVAKLYACYSPLKFNVNLNAGTGILNGSNKIEVEVSENAQSVTIPATASEYGYTFAGWSVPDNTANATVTNKTTLNLQADAYFASGLTLTATFTQNGVKVTYTNTSHGSFEPVEATYIYNRDTLIETSYTFPTITPQSGYEFSGWTLQVGQEITTYNVGSAEPLSQEIVNELYNYAVRSGTLNTSTGIATISLQANWPAKSGISYSIKVYTETTKSSGTTIDYTLQTTATGYGVTAATIYIANTKDGNNNDVYGADYYARFNNNYLTHYTLVTTQTDLNNATIAGDGTTEISLYYNRIAYNLIIKNYYQSINGSEWVDDSDSATKTGGTTSSNTPYKHGYPLTGLTAEVESGFEWDGYFYQNSDGTGTQYTASSIMPTTDLTIYARFARKQFVVTVSSVYQEVSSTSWTVDKSNQVAGTITGSGNSGYYKSKLLAVVSATAKIGFTFAGFYTTYSNGAFSGEVTETTIIGVSDITLYAKFNRNNVTLTITKDTNITSFTVKGTTYSSNSANITLKYQESFTLTVVTKNGYVAQISATNLTLVGETSSTDSVNITTYTNEYSCETGSVIHSIAITSSAASVTYNVYHAVQSLSGTYSAGSAISKTKTAFEDVTISALHMSGYTTNYIYKGYSASFSSSAAGVNNSTTQVEIDGNGQTKIYLYYQLKTYQLSVVTADDTTTESNSSVKINNATYSSAVFITQTADVSVTIVIKYGFTLKNMYVNGTAAENSLTFSQISSNSTTITYNATFNVSGNIVSGKNNGDTIPLVYASTRNSYTVTVVSSPDGYGTVTPTSVNLPYETVITASENKLKVNGKTISTATPTPSNSQYTYNFSKWTVSGTAISTTKVLDNTTITANFTRSVNKYLVTINVSASGWGTVTKNSVTQVDYGTIITASGATLSIGSIIAINATPATDTAQYDYEFVKWTQSTTTGSNVASNSVTVQGDTTIYANFSRTVKQYKVTIVADPTGYGTVNPTEVTVDYGTNITANKATLTVGSQTVKAESASQTAEYTYSLKNWTIDSTTGTEIKSTSVPVQGEMTIFANFTRTVRQYTITISVNNPNWGSVDTTSVKLDYGTEITASTSSKTLSVEDTIICTATVTNITGYITTLDNWASNSNGVASAQFTVTGNSTIYANFSRVADTFTLTLNASKPKNLNYNSADATKTATASAEVYSGTTKITSKNQLTITFTYDSDAILAKDQYTLDGWTLLGWELSATNGLTATRYSETISSTTINSWYNNYKAGKMTSLYAVWQPNEYIVNYYRFTGNNQIVCGTTTHTYDEDRKTTLLDGSSVTNICPNAGYIFTGWGVTAGVENVLNEQDFTKNNQAQTALWSITDNKYSESINLYARYKYAKIAIIANATSNGGKISNLEGWTTYTSGAYKVITYKSAFGTLPVATKTDCRFDGWFTTKSGNGTQITSSTIMNYTTATTIYARFTKIVFNITWNGNATAGDLLEANLWNYAGSAGYTSANTGSNAKYTTSGVEATSRVTVDQPLGYWAPIPIRRGYTFNGWYTAETGGTKVADATGALVASVSGYTNSSKKWIKYADITLYAQYSIKNYTITINSNGGSAIDATTYNTTTGTTINAPSRAGYTFAGWQVLVYLDKLYNATIDIDTGVQNYYSAWGDVPVYYEMFYIKTGINYTASLSSDQVRWRSYNAETGKIADPLNYSMEQTVAGNNTNIMLWYHLGKQAFSEFTWVSFISETGNFVTTDYKLTGNILLNAKWAPVTYTITYDLAGGTVDTANPKTYTIESNTFSLNNPTRDNYNFAGWTGTDLSEATQTVTITKGSYGSRMYTATWTPVEYTITYNLDGGTADNPTSYNIETTAFTLTEPTKTGYTFTGWIGTDVTDVTKTVTVGGGQSGDREYTAHYKVNNYLIEIDTGFINFTLGDYEEYIGEEFYYTNPHHGLGYIYQEVSRDYMFTDSITINVWAYMDTWADYAAKDMRIYSCTETGGWNIEPKADTKEIVFACYDDGKKGYNNINTGILWSSLETGWHMFTMTFDGKTLSGYIDGKNVGTSIFEGKIGYNQNSTNLIHIGAEATGDSYAGTLFTGYMEGMTIAHECYTSENINTIYNSFQRPSLSYTKIYIQQPYNQEFTFSNYWVAHNLEYTRTQLNISGMDTFNHIIDGESTTATTISNSDATKFSQLNATDGAVVKLSVSFTKNRLAGIYADMSNARLIYTWDQAVSMGYIKVDGHTMTDYTYKDRDHDLVVSKAITTLGLDPLTSSYGLFENNSKIKHIEIPNSVIRIAGNAFSGCTGLTNVIIPDSVTSLGYTSFANCTNLQSIELSANITSIPRYAFAGCKNLTNITIPDKVTNIEEGAFNNCTSLTSVTFPSGLISIKDFAFGNCGNVISYYFTTFTTIPSIEKSAFAALNADCKIYVPGYLYSKWIVADNWDDYASYIVPVHIEGIYNVDYTELLYTWDEAVENGYIELSSYDFSITDFTYTGECTLVLPTSVTRVANYTFEEKTNVKKYIFLGDVTYVGLYAFAYCGTSNTIAIYLTNCSNVPDFRLVNENSTTNVAYSPFYRSNCLIYIPIDSNISDWEHELWDVKHEQGYNWTLVLEAS